MTFYYLMQLEEVRSQIDRFNGMYADGINWGFQLGLGVLAACSAYALLVHLFK